MSYTYQTQRANLFTDDGQRLCLRVRDKAQALLKAAGAVRMDKLMDGGGDTWMMLAAVDRLVELCEIVEVTPAGTRGQDRVFVAVR